MKKEDKSKVVEQIVDTISAYNHFYLINIFSLNAEKTSALRRECAKQNVKLMVVKNTLLKNAFEKLDTDFAPLYDTLKGDTALMFSETANLPAKLLKNFEKGDSAYPQLKAAYAEESFYIGADQLDALLHIKSKTELIGEVIGLLQSPAKNVISALQSGGSTIHGILTTLSER